MQPTITSMLRSQMVYLKKMDLKGYNRMCAMIVAMEGSPATNFKQICFVYGKNN